MAQKGTVDLFLLWVLFIICACEHRVNIPKGNQFPEQSNKMHTGDKSKPVEMPYLTPFPTQSCQSLYSSQWIQ